MKEDNKKKQIRDRIIKRVRDQYSIDEHNAIPDNVLSSFHEDTSPFFSLIASMSETQSRLRDDDIFKKGFRSPKGKEKGPVSPKGKEKDNTLPPVAPPQDESKHQKPPKRPASKIDALVLYSWVEEAIVTVNDLRERTYASRKSYIIRENEDNKLEEFEKQIVQNKVEKEKQTEKLIESQRVPMQRTQDLSKLVESLESEEVKEKYNGMDQDEIDKLDAEITTVVESAVPKLSMTLHEIIQQCTNHCSETGMVLEKIWRTYVELSDRALKDLRDSLKMQQIHVNKVEAELHNTRQEAKEIKIKHPQHLERLGETLKLKFCQRHQEQCNELKFTEAENSALKLVLEERKIDIKQLFPHFERYKHLQLMPKKKPTKENIEEKRRDLILSIAADIEFLLDGSDDRKEIPIYISPLLGRTSVELASLKQEFLENQQIIEDLKAQIKNDNPNGVPVT